ncbi:MAG: 16S rRNA (cytosine(967)-C(5))-methyltransferase RsmB [Pseudomonadales bacterium]|nr:16S rRNA (cytosine(967)-C(5))-methyltransferase RsmB [Halioglobus sp.]MCP5121219.1 16S rRNA (cytosine(967)-C(5))-methyltransferase RsmB [Pseudomonadales bacterium]MCP5193441.1 16S rRNA (cytosine(967)-C(5))-methyltransferase RsmB [Pseudomonadales bacterium]
MALDPRAAAARVIGEVLTGSSLNQALPPRLAQVAERERGLLQQLCYGTLRQAPRLQALLAQLLNKPLRDKDSDLQGLLLCGLYQLEGTRIPDHAAVAATVGAVAVLKKNWARGMTNAVLRRFLRERQTLSDNLSEAAAASHPQWLYQALQQQWPGAAAAILAANNQQPPMVLRVNSRLISRQAYLDKLAGQGIEATAGQLSSQAVYLAQPRDVAQLPGFAEGEASVQDEAAQLAAPLLRPGPGERILDACAAPGGKACHLLELQPELAELVAMDVDEIRLQKVSQNLQRLQLQATLLAGDARRPPATLAPASFDRILVDAPCSATGVIRRHPDVKLLRRPEDIDAMAHQQLAILEGLWPLLKPGGTLLYATCSVLAEENSAVVQRFLATCREAGEVSPGVSWGETTDSGRQLLPSPSAADGLFYALLGKSA